MQREVICWLQSLDLTHQIRHPQQELSNGFTFAEIISRYDHRVSMHSYMPGCSSECKRRNWKVLLRDLKRVGCNAVTAEMAEGTIQGRPGVALHVLEIFYAFFCGRPISHLTKKENDSSTVALSLNKSNVLFASKSSLDVTLSQHKNTSQLLRTESNKNVFFRELQQPGFARPTVAALLHLENSDTRNAMLAAAVPADELQIKLRNERLLNERKVFDRAYKHAEPQRFSVRPLNRNTIPVGKSNAKAFSGRTGATRENKATVDKVSVVAVNFANNQLLAAARLQTAHGNNESLISTEELHDSGTSELLKSCDNSLRLGLSKILSLILESYDLKNTKNMGDLSSEDLAHDALSTFVGRREDLPFAILSACWTALLDASGGIASALLARPTEYMYLLQVFQFAFSADVARVRMLHVSGPTKNEDCLKEKETNKAFLNKLHVDHRIKHRSLCVIDKLQSVSIDADERQQVIFLNECAYNVASVFSVLCSIGAAVYEMSPSVSLSLVTNYFLPTASRLFSLASSAILEAIARVVVAHVCGGAFTRRNKPTTETSMDGAKVKNQINEDELLLLNIQREDALRQMTQLLDGSIKKAFFQEGSEGTTNFSRQRFQYDLFMYHVLRHMQFIFKTPNMESEKNEQSDNLSLQLSNQTASMATSTSKLTPSPPAYGLSTPVELCYANIFTCLGSAYMHERSVGLAVLLQFLAWDRWELVIDPFFVVVNDIRERGMSSGFLQRAADTWEIRVLLLELLTNAFCKALYALADNAENSSFMGELTGDGNSFLSDSPLTDAFLIRQKFDFNLVEEAIVACLLVFLDAPHLQRQVALQIVGARLLPEKQRRVAVLWLRCLFSCPVEQLDFLLRPSEKLQSRVEEGSRTSPKNQQMRYSCTSNSTQRGVLGRRRLCSRQEMNIEEVAEQAMLSYLAKRGGDFLNEGNSSVRLLFGRVEPVYIVAPLNQSWDTFSVVHAAVMFQEMLTTTQVFSLVLAALSGSQRPEVQRLKLFRSLRSVTYCGVGSVAVESTASPATILSSFVADFTEEKIDKPSDLTLKELVGGFDNTHTTTNDSVKVDVNDGGGDDLFLRFSSLTGGCVGDEEEANLQGVAWRISAEKERNEEDRNEGENVLKMIQFHEESFWFYVLRLLKAQLQECIVNRGLSPRQRSGKSASAVSIETNRTELFACRIAKTENSALLQPLAVALLLKFFCRFGPVSTGEVSLQEDFLQQALRWLADM